MTRQLDLDRAMEEWLSEGPRQLSDRAIEAIANQLHQTKQRKPGWLPRRPELTRSLWALGGVAAAVVLVVVVGAMFLGLNANRPGVGGQPSAPPTSAPSPTAAPPTSTPDAGLPEGPFGLEDNGIAMTVSIPASGWTFNRDVNSLQKGTAVANLPEATVLLWSFPAGTEFYVPRDPCQMTSTRPDTPATTADDLAAALAAQASRDASRPEDVTVGGYEGKSIILHVPDDAEIDECEGGEFVSYGTEQDPLSRYHQGPGQIDELWILDVDGSIVVLDAMYRPGTPAGLVEEMRTIAESATFETP
jgi:hypothetical protein